MLKLNDLKPAEGSTKNRKRIGRGTGSGQGCTAGKGNNGDKARSGAYTKDYFEGGQNPLHLRVPKRGFYNPFRKEYQIVNVGDIQTAEITDAVIDAAVLRKNGLIHNADLPVKVLGNGELAKAITIKADAFSKSAVEKIEKANGKVEKVDNA